MTSGATTATDDIGPRLHHITIVENFRGSRKISVGLKYLNIGGFDSRQGAKHAKFGGE
jgi:hypothetical protein